MARPYKVLLRGYEEKARTRLKEDLGELLGVGAGHADDILASAPIVLFDNLSKKEAEKVVEKMKKAIEGGAEIVSTRESLTDVARVEWPELPQVVKDVLVTEDEEKKEAEEEKKAEEKPKKKKKRRRKATKEDLEAAEEAEKEEVVVSKYDFTVDQIEVENKWVFCCPRCGAMFQLLPLTEEERQEALAQKEIEKILERREAAISPVVDGTEDAGGETKEEEMLEPLDELPIVEEEPLAVPLAEEPEVKDDFSVTMDELERHAEEAYSKRTEQEQLPMVEPATPPEELPVPKEETEEAEEAPSSEEEEATKEVVSEKAEEEPAEEMELKPEEQASIADGETERIAAEQVAAVREQETEYEREGEPLEPPASTEVEESVEEGIMEKETGIVERLENLPQEEQQPVLKQPEAPPVEEVPPEEVLKLLKTRKKRATSREQERIEKLRKALATKRAARPAKPTTMVPPRKPSMTPKKEGAAGKTGGCVVVLPTVRIRADTQKLNTAAEIVAQVTGKGVDDVRATLRDRPIVTVARGITKEEAEEIRQKFRSAGITVRITEPRTRPRR